jgi:conjugal transfer pilus assembly protein TraF
MDEFKKIYNAIYSTAVLNPSKPHVLEWLRANTLIGEKSNYFADQARRLVWTNPEVDYTARSPQANYALANTKQRENNSRMEVAAKVGEDWGVLFFFRSNCPYCHDMAPVVKNLERHYGMEVVGVTLDGRRIPEFPNAIIDKGLSNIVSGGEGIDVVPATYLVSRDKKRFILLGTGALASNELVDRIRVLLFTPVGENRGVY